MPAVVIAAASARPPVLAGRRAGTARPLVALARPSHPLARSTRTIAAAAPEPSSSGSGSSSGSSSSGAEDEEVFYQGSGSNAELAVSLLLGTLIITLPLTLASIGRRLWISYKFTSKRLVVTTNSPVLQREVQVEYSKIKEIRSAPRAFGLWGDVVVFLKDGSRLELAGLERFDEIVKYMQARLTA